MKLTGRRLQLVIRNVDDVHVEAQLVVDGIGQICLQSAAWQHNESVHFTHNLSKGSTRINISKVDGIVLRACKLHMIYP